MSTVHRIPTNSYDLTLSFKVIMDRPVVLRIKGYDTHPLHANSLYFDRVFGMPGQPIKGVKIIKAPMPVSPGNLTLIAYDDITGSQAGIRVEDVIAEPLDKRIVAFNTPDDYDFFRFLEEFVKQCGYSATGTYTSNSGKFKIIYSDRLYDKEGKELTTPARIFYPNGEIEFSKPQFNKITIPMRMFLGLHERCHFKLGHGKNIGYRSPEAGRKMEMQADKYALGIYLGMGYPKSEAMYAFTKVFKPINNSQSHAQDLLARMDDASSFIKQF